MKSFSYKTLIFFLQKVLFLLHFASCQNCMSSAKLATENHQKLCNKRVLSTGEPCACEYVTLLQSFHRGTLNIHWYIAQNFSLPFHICLIQMLIQDCHLQQILYGGYGDIRFHILFSYIFCRQFCFLFPCFRYIISNQRDDFF